MSWLRSDPSSRGVLTLAVAATLLCLVFGAPGLAQAAGPAWSVTSLANTTAPPGGSLTYLVEAKNIGDAGTTAPNDPTCDPNTPPIDVGCIRLAATLPAGLTAVSISGGAFNNAECAGLGIAGPTVVTCASSDVLVTTLTEPANSFRTVALTVAVDPDASGILTSAFDVSGGGAASTATTVDPTRVAPTASAFGVDAFDGQVVDGSGDPVTQAGGHPYAATTSIDFNTFENPNTSIGLAWPVEPTKDVVVDLPPGFVGNPTVTDKCTTPELAQTDGHPLCSPSSQVGTTVVRLNGFMNVNYVGPLAVYNMVPPPGVPARFGFNVAGSVVTLDARLRSGSDYGLSVNAANVSEGLAVAGTSLTFWGVPADSSHDAERACAGQISPSAGGGSCASGRPRKAFLRNPTSCAAPAGAVVSDGLETFLHVDSWPNPGRRNADGSPNLTDPAWRSASFVSHVPPAYPAIPANWGAHQLPTGCENVPFDPTFAATPDAPARAGSPSGFTFDVDLPQSDDPSAIGESDLRKAVVTLPDGVHVSPATADGLEACTEDEVGLASTADAQCPEASKVGALTITTPLLDQPLTGAIYLATPHKNTFDSLIAVYLVAKGQGIIVKVAGKVESEDGRLTATFDNNPQTPFSNLHLQFYGGPRAALVAPSVCGTYTTHTQFTSWSGKVVASDSDFTIDRASDGGACAPLGFSPGFTAGTENPVAGVFTPFNLLLQRTDTDEEFRSLASLSLPPGLLADVGSVSTRCTEDQARVAACPVASHIGEVNVGAGSGPDPFYVPGDVYLTGPYKGNPFGIAVIVHAQAGPFDLGYVVVRGAIQIHDDGSVTVATDPFPTILQGIPLQVKDIRVNLDRPGFMFNPTSCDPMSINGTVLSTDNQQAGVSSRFQVGECANLAFKPSFTVSTAGKTSKANGASLHVHLATHEGPSSTGAARESNIAKVDVQLPVVLPARLPTLQKACTAAQFAANPAGCPEGSFVGTAVAHTPILASPLSGPAILVSHGGQAFPDLVLVLQGEGVRINLTGHTQIKKGITYNHFETVPDAPVSSFDLTLPAGPHGVLTTDIPGRNLCATMRTVTVTKRITRRTHGHTRRVTVKAKKAVAAPLLMPTTITAQNGAVIHQNTKIAVTGCGNAKVTKHKARRKRK